MRVLAEMKRASELDLLSSGITTNVGFPLTLQEDYDAAKRQAAQALELDPNCYLAQFCRLGRKSIGFPTRFVYRASPRHAAEESPARAAAAVLSTVEDCTWPRARPMLESQHLPRCNAWPTGRIQSLALETCDKSVLLGR